MHAKATVLTTAEFNPKIKTYLLLYGAIILTCTLVGIALLPVFLLIGPYIYQKVFYAPFCRAHHSCPAI